MDNLDKRNNLQVGIVLCADKSNSVVKYTMPEGLDLKMQCKQCKRILTMVQLIGISTMQKEMIYICFNII